MPGFHVSAHYTHFMWLGVSQLRLSIIVPSDSPDSDGDCVAITIIDFPFKAKVFDVKQIRSTLYANFKEN